MTDAADGSSDWHAADAHALAALIQRDIDWIRGHLSRRLGDLLRRRNDTDDIVQLTLVEVLRDGLRFPVTSRRQFRALIAQISENVLRAEFDRHTARRRDLRRENPIASGDATVRPWGAASVTSPSSAAAASELHSEIRIALELLHAEDRNLIVLRDYRTLSFAAIGEQVGLPEKTVQRRYGRALRRLVERIDELRRGSTPPPDENA